MLDTFSIADKDTMISLHAVWFRGVDACGSISNASWRFADEGTKRCRHVGEEGS